MMHNMHGIQLQKKSLYAVGVCVDTGFEVLDLGLDWIPLLFRCGHHKLPIIDA